MLDGIRRRAKHLAERQQLAGAYKRFFESPDGRLILMDLCKQAGLTRFKSSVNSLEGYYEVQRFMFSILNQVHMDPNVLLEQLEHLNRTTYEDMESRSVEE
jgi:hypothetical protein